MQLQEDQRLRQHTSEALSEGRGAQLLVLSVGYLVLRSGRKDAYAETRRKLVVEAPSADDSAVGE